MEPLTGENYDSLYDYLDFKIIQPAVPRRRNVLSGGHMQAYFSYVALASPDGHSAHNYGSQSRGVQLALGGIANPKAENLWRGGSGVREGGTSGPKGDR